MRVSFQPRCSPPRACQSYVAVPVQPVTIGRFRSGTRCGCSPRPTAAGGGRQLLHVRQTAKAGRGPCRTSTAEWMPSPLRWTIRWRLPTHRVRNGGACGPPGTPTPAQVQQRVEASRFLLRCRVGLLPILSRRGTFHQDPSAPAPSCAGATTRQRSSPSNLAATVQVGVNGSRAARDGTLTLALQQRGFLRDGAKNRGSRSHRRRGCPTRRTGSSCCRRNPGDRGRRRSVRDHGSGRYALGAGPVANYANIAQLVRLRRTPQGRGGGRRGVAPGRDAGPACAPIRLRRRMRRSGPPFPPATRAATARPRYQIASRTAASECHTFCGGQVPAALPGPRLRVLRAGRDVWQRRREPRALPALRRGGRSLGRCCSGAPLSSGRAGSAGGARCADAAMPPG